MLKPKLTHQAAAALTGMAQPMRGRITGVIDKLAASDGAAPASNPVPLLFPQRQVFVDDLERPGGRWRVVFCTYPDQRLLHVPIIELAPVF